jgi:acyl-CoA thioesterase
MAGMASGPDGLTYVRAVRDGQRPGDPLMVHLGIRVVQAEPGRVAMEVTPTADHLNLGGIVHGGLLSSLMDSATGFALHTTLAPGDTPPHLSASYRFLGMARAGVALRASAEVLKAGSRIGHVRVDVRDAAGRLVATGETTHAVVPIPSLSSPERG